MATKGLEGVVDEKMKSVDVKKVMVTGDYHIPYMDYRAYDITKANAKKYKPDIFVINGDFLDCYSISMFDKNPLRKSNLKDEVDLGRKILKDLKESLPKKTEIYLLDGNHDMRIERRLWQDSEMYEVAAEYLNMQNLLQLDKLGIKYVRGDMDYWKKDTGHLRLGDVLIMHGDNRLNGAKGGMNAAINTAKNLRTNTIINHTHNLNLKYESNPYNEIFGGNAGCLCDLTGTANWQQGFFTFELVDEKAVNPQIHKINDGILYENGVVYKANN